MREYGRHGRRITRTIKLKYALKWACIFSMLTFFLSMLFFGSASGTGLMIGEAFLLTFMVFVIAMFIGYISYQENYI